MSGKCYAHTIHRKCRLAFEGGHYTLTELAEEIGASYNTILSWRMNEAWDIDRARENRKIRRIKGDPPRNIVLDEAELARTMAVHIGEVERKETLKANSAKIVHDPDSGETTVADPRGLISPDITSTDIQESSDVRNSIIKSNDYRQGMSDDLANMARSIVDAITVKDIESASLREKVSSADMLLKQSRLQADMSTENIAHGVQGNIGMVMKMADEMMRQGRFGRIDPAAEDVPAPPTPSEPEIVVDAKEVDSE